MTAADTFAITPESGGTLRERALAELRHLIASGALAPGDRIVEREIAQRYGMSRGPVREAVRALEHEGLVEARPYAGVRVARIDRDDIEELIALRRQVEYFSIARSALRATPQDVATLTALADEMLPAYRDRDVLRCIELDFRFHMAICEASGHAILGQMLKTLMPRLIVVWYPDLQDSSDPDDTMQRDHYALIEPIKARDVEAGLVALDQHIDGLYTALTLRYDRAPAAVPGPQANGAFRPVRPVAVQRRLGT
jgi:DNA-binding GntR family transcriptional regulator